MLESTQSPSWRNPTTFLILVSIVVPIAFSSWMALLNNFAVEKASFSGADMGLLQSIREVPGILAFTAVFLLMFIREQRFLLISLAMLSLGTAITGYFPSLFGLLFTTLLMSTGFHYFETLKQSLSLQWLNKAEAPEMMGKMISLGALASLITYSALWLMLHFLKLDYKWIYLISGGLGFVIVVVIAFMFPEFSATTPQNKKLVVRKRYWLYYALTFLSGARRQIFTVFAGFLMVEKFGYSASDITLLFLINYAFNFMFAKRIGKLIGKVGERRTLIFEYTGLAIIFISYGFVSNSHVAAGLYVVDHLFFALALAIKTYFQKIADPSDMASTAAVSFTINHIAAIVIPVTFGLIWMYSPSTVFFLGAGIAVCSLVLSMIIPRHPEEGNETTLKHALR